MALSPAEHEQQTRTERARAIGLFRYQLIREAADPQHSTKHRGRLIRAIAAAEHTDPFGGQVRVSRQTLDRWIRDWRTGGFDALVPSPRQTHQRTPAEVMELAVALRRENPERTAAAIRRILRTQLGWSPDERTLQRHFTRIGLAGPAATGPASVFGRFEAERPNQLWTGDALHGPQVAGRKTYLLPLSTTTPGRWWAIGSAMPRTPCGWPPRCARPWPRVVSRRQSTSITGRRSWMPGCCARARSWGSG
ncbi:MAG TPA: helix-turn-helix domain-containing protein [Pseudonocardiaceae bacterium]|nr:helix-turn-helix domain-containing protein [Pseudonocardiaceae bacterium]